MGSCLPHFIKITRKQKHINNQNIQPNKQSQVFDTIHHQYCENDIGGETKESELKGQIIQQGEKQLMDQQNQRETQKTLETQMTDNLFASQEKVNKSQIVPTTPNPDNYLIPTNNKLNECDKQNLAPFPQQEEANFTFAKKVTFYQNAKQLPTVMELSLEQIQSSVFNSRIMNSQIQKSTQQRRIDQNPMILQSRWAQGKVYGSKVL